MNCPQESDGSTAAAAADAARPLDPRIPGRPRWWCQGGLPGEVDYYWRKLSEGGREMACGWLKDKYGLSWQVIPIVLIDMISDPDPEKAKRATEAMLAMTKFDIAALRRRKRGSKGRHGRHERLHAAGPRAREVTRPPGRSQACPLSPSKGVSGIWGSRR